MQHVCRLCNPLGGGLLESFHGGDIYSASVAAGCRPGSFLDASASVTPLGIPLALRWKLLSLNLRPYPDRSHRRLKALLGGLHQIEPDLVLPGNGAAELFTWAARDAAQCGLSTLLQPGFGDYVRALRCWDGAVRPFPLPLQWDQAFPHAVPDCGSGDVLWITNPHNPTGQLWSRASLEPLLERYRLVICDEAFLPLVPNGEEQSLIPLAATPPNLGVSRSLTKL